MATGYNLRVGDADREAIAAQLREHYADGRLTLEELNERLDQTFAARTRADLNVVMRDLPHITRPLAGAAISIVENEENPGYYAATFELRPHFQLEGMDIGLRLVSRLPVAK